MFTAMMRACLGALLAAAVAQASAPERMAFIQVVKHGDSLAIVDVMVVPGHAPMPRDPDRIRPERKWICSVRDAAGGTVWSGALPDPFARSRHRVFIFGEFGVVRRLARFALGECGAFLVAQLRAFLAVFASAVDVVAGGADLRCRSRRGRGRARGRERQHEREPDRGPGRDNGAERRDHGY